MSVVVGRWLVVYDVLCSHELLCSLSFFYWVVLFSSLVSPLYVSEPYEQWFAFFVFYFVSLPLLPVHRRRTRWSSFFVLFVFLSLLVCWPSFFFSFPASSPSLSHYLTRGALCFQRPVAPAALHCSPTFVPFVFLWASFASHGESQMHCT